MLCTTSLALVGSHPGIDAERIFVVGHSEGAMVAPKVAAAFPGTRGIVMTAPGVRPIDVMLIEQIEFEGKLTGRSADEIAEQTKELTATFELLKERAGSSGGRVSYRSFSGLNHLFMRVERASTGAEYGIPGHVDPAVVSAIADWILLR